jgi:peptidoglycan-N-acetylmuramic acid deacetylase
MDNGRYLLNRIIRFFLIVSFAFLGTLVYMLEDSTKPEILMGVYNTSYDSVSFDHEIPYLFSDSVVPVSIDSAGNRSWGIKRNKGALPDPDPGSVELLEKHNGVWTGDTSKKIIYITFDQGYENGYTDRILDTLKEKKVKTVFFVTGPYLEKNDRLIRRFVDEGHYVGNHTVRHKSMPLLSRAEAEKELLELEKAFEEKYNAQMLFFRPPMGEYNEETLKIAKELRYTTMFWSFAYDDWLKDKVRGPEYVVNLVSQNAHNGMIILFHAVSPDNAKALGSVIDTLRGMGYEFGDPIELYKP